MCGIFTFLTPESNKVNCEMLVRMSNSLAHRGPDDYGYAFFELWGGQKCIESREIPREEELARFNGLLTFGHRRLSIIDLSDAGHQPMCNETGNIWVTFNGEIYNYVELTEELLKKGHIFKSKTDTEVILHAYEEWGMQCLNHFNGMWAFALWDKKRKRLFCSRDRFGIKPLYYYFNGRKFILASEIKAILQDQLIERSPNHNRMCDYLAYGYLDHTEDTFFQNVYQLRGSHYLTLEILGTNDFQLDIRPYWDLRPKECEIEDGGGDFKERFYELLEDSIRLHMRSDVPVGTCLSGGIDSSSIVCLAKHFLDSNVHKTFSSCFDDKKYDEREFINKVVEVTDSDSHYVFPKPEDLLQEIEDLVWYQEEPFGSTSVFAQWNVFKLIKLNQVKVILDGQGADEILAGYHPYFGSYLNELLRTLKIRKFLKEYKMIRAKQHYSHQWIISHFLVFFLPPTLVNVLNERILPYKEKWFHLGGYPLKNILFRRGLENVFFNHLYLSLMYLTLPRLLHTEDRNSMAYSIEARVPFLDYRLVEFIFSLPMSQIIQNGMTKVILRETMKGILPEMVRNRVDKMGFVTPEDIWFKGLLKDYILEIIGSRSFGGRGYFNLREVHKTFHRYCEGQLNLSSKIWRWVNLELWFRIFIDRKN